MAPDFWLKALTDTDLLELMFQVLLHYSFREALKFISLDVATETRRLVDFEQPSDYLHFTRR